MPWIFRRQTPRKGQVFTQRNIISTESKFQVVEAYKAIRTNLRFVLAGQEGARAVCFSSAMPGEGKTVTCVNMAMVFAQNDYKVLIVDADMRKPKLARYLGLTDGTGLSDVLGGFAALEHCIVKEALPGVDCLPAGQIPPNPSELLSSGAMRVVLDQALESYDYVLIDSPPITLVSDAAIIAGLGVGVVFVARHRYTSHDAVRRAMSRFELAQVKLLGFIFNDVPERKKIYEGGKYDYAESADALRGKA